MKIKIRWPNVHAKYNYKKRNIMNKVPECWGKKTRILDNNEYDNISELILNINIDIRNNAHDVVKKYTHVIHAGNNSIEKLHVRNIKKCTPDSRVI